MFAAVSFVRFQGTQDRISLILGSGFLLSGATLTASSVIFFQLIHESQFWFLWAPIGWWISRLLLALLFVVALLVEHFLPRSRHPRLEIAGALFAVLSLTYLIAASIENCHPMFPDTRSVHSQSTAAFACSYLPDCTGGIPAQEISSATLRLTVRFIMRSG